MISLKALGAFAGALFITCAPMPAHAAPLSRGETRAAVRELAGMLERNYVYPEVGAQYAARLRERSNAGAYRGLDDEALAETLTNDLRAVHPDAHLAVTLADHDDEGHASVRRIPSGAEALEDERWLADGVAYLNIHVFGEAADVPRTEAILDRISDANTLIIDLRRCYGGTTPVMDALLSRLYAERTELLTMDTRSDNPDDSPYQETATMRRAQAPAGTQRLKHYAVPSAPVSSLADAPVFVLVGHTASACEHFARALQVTGRAVLVGETTVGAGHFGAHHLFGGDRFQVFLPVGRTYPASTGEDWEGRGVTPDRAIPAADALNAVLTELGVAAQASSSTSQ